MTGAATLERLETGATSAPVAADLWDLERDAGAGLVVRASYFPTLAAPIGATVAAFDPAGDVLEAIDVAPGAAFETWRHAALVLPALRELLARRPDPLPDPCGSDSEEDPSDV